MASITMEIPEAILIALKETPDSMSRSLRILAAAKMVELGRLSSGKAPELAGVGVVEFLDHLGAMKISIMGDITFEDIMRDAENAKAAFSP